MGKRSMPRSGSRLPVDRDPRRQLGAANVLCLVDGDELLPVVRVSPNDGWRIAVEQRRDAALSA